jgi:hypothetical protein
MKMKNFSLSIIRHVLPVLLAAFLHGGLAAQESGSCAEKLKSAQASFTRGQTDIIPSLLSQCLRTGGFKREEELAASKLLIQTYLLNDKLSQADSAMLAFLKRNPEYKTSPTDHSSFVYLYNTYQVKSLLTLSIRVGTNVPFLTFITEHPTSGEPGKSEFSSDAANFFLSFEAKFNPFPRVEIGMGAGYSQLKWSNTITNYNNFADIYYKEVQQRLEVPVFAIYDLTASPRLIPYLRAGTGACFNLSTSADASLTMYPGTKQSNLTGSTLKRNDSRVAIDPFLQVGAGIKYKIPRGFIFAEVRSNLGIRQQLVPGGTKVDDLQQYYKWSDPEFRLNSFNMNAGVSIIFFKPSKKEVAQ